MALFEENIRRIINSIQMAAIGNALQLFYGMDTKNCSGKYFFSSYLHEYNTYYRYD